MNRWYCQSGVIAYRWEDDEPEVLLITSTSRRHWVIPKGNVEVDLTAAESALQEAWEEAGIRGKILQPACGEYGYEKWGRRYRVEVFLMEVEKEVAHWPEDDVRKRRWFSFDEAVRRVEDPKLRQLLRLAVTSIEPAAR